MRHFRLLSAALLAACFTIPALALAEDDKTAEKAPPADSTTQGSIDIAGQHIAYTTIAGTLTVGATDVQDAQLGPDGKPQPGSNARIRATV